MKALLTAFALLSFVAASTVPYAAQAQTTTQQPTAKKHVKKAKKHSKKVATHKKAAKKHVKKAA